MKLTQAQFRRAAYFSGNFGLAKLSIYFAPLAMASFALPETYAGMELAFALAPFIALVLGSPFLSAVPQLYLVRGEKRVFDLGAGVAAAAASLMTLAGIALLFAGETIPAMACFAAACVSVQGAASTLTRTLSRRNIAAWADGMAALAMFLAAGAAWFVFGSWFDAGDAAITWAIVSLVLAMVAMLLFRRWREPGLRARLAAAWQIGLPMVINGLFGMVIGSGGRIAFGAFAQPWDLSAYAIGFRIAGLMLGLHQLMITAFFARVYAARTRAFDRTAPLYLLAVAGGGVLLCLASPLLLPHLGFKALTADRQGALLDWLPLIALQVYLWIGFATLELRINRARMARRLILPNLAVTAAGVAGFFWLESTGLASPANIVAFMAVVTALFVAIQIAMLWWRGLVLPRTATSLAAGAVPFLILALA